MKKLCERLWTLIIRWARKKQLQMRSKKERWVSILSPYYEDDERDLYAHIVDMNDYGDKE